MIRFISKCNNQSAKLTDLQNKPIHHFIVFSFNQCTYLISKQYSSPHLSLTLIYNLAQLSCQLVKSIEGQYKEELVQLMSMIKSSETYKVKNTHMCIYLINSKIDEDRKEYEVANPSYGEQIVLLEGNQIRQSIFSNCFRLNSQYFYFYSHQNEPNTQLCLLLDSSQSKIYGLGFTFGNSGFCLPIGQIFKITPTTFQSNLTTLKNMRSVVYVTFQSSRCTGILLNEKFIITVRHLFELPQSAGTAVTVRLFPYNRAEEARLMNIPSDFIDLIVLELVDKEKRKKGNQRFDQLVSGCKLEVGNKISAIGFGKYAYQNNAFEKIRECYPTVTSGVISKIIESQLLTLFFKTDAYLENGYSGCPIWSNQTWIGNAVFIIKNKTNSQKLARQNFSYPISFIQKVLKGGEKEKELQASKLQKIQQRKVLKLVAKL